MSSVVCIIPAKGYSQGVEGKNRRQLCGKPLLAWTIEQALAAKCIKRERDRVIVSSEAPVIREIAITHGAAALARPPEMAQADSSSEEALFHVLHSLEAKQGGPGLPDLTVFLQCTSPIRDPNDIDDAVAEFEQRGFDSMLSVTPSHRLLWRQEDGTAQGVNHSAYVSRQMRQEMGPQYMENGSIYVFKTDVFMKVKRRFFGRIGLYIQKNPWAWIDIDTEEDFKLAEWVMKGGPNSAEYAQAGAPDIRRGA